MVQTIVTADLQMVMVLSFDRHAPRTHINSLIDRLVAQPQVVELSELEGAADLMIEAVLPNLAAYQDFVATNLDGVRRFISRTDTHFICRRHSNHAEDDVIWAQGRRGMRPVSLARVDAVVAEGDYVRLLTDGETVLFHSTLQSVVDRLPAGDFVQIHRSTVVRRASIRRLVRCGRRWKVELPDSSTHLIAKARVAELSGELGEGRNGQVRTSSSNVVPVGVPVEPV